MAILELNRYLRNHPDAEYAVGFKVAALLKLFQAQEALDVLDAFEAGHGPGRELANFRAYALAAAGRDGEARALYIANGMEMLGTVESERLGFLVQPPEDRAELDQRLERYRAVGASDTQIVMETLTWLGNRGLDQEALAVAEDAMHKGNVEQPVAHERARLLLAAGRFDDALELLEAVLARSPGSNWAVQLMLPLLAKRRRFGKMVGILFRAALISARSTTVYDRALKS